MSPTVFLPVTLRQLLHRTALIIVLSACTLAQANDGLGIGGVTQWAAIAGRAYTFTPKVVNPSGRHLTFAIVNKPAWVAFNTSTGQLSGTPSIVQTYYNIAISVTDGVSTAKSAYFGIRVYPPNTWDKPMISGTPPTSVSAGGTYVFQPSARDAYGQPLSFSVKNKPAWASFSIGTGRLYGTPTSAQAGAYGNIQISASNGELTAALPAFSIAVNGGSGAGTGTGSATLSWQPPTENTNGTPLSDLAGIRIYYGTSSSNLSKMVEAAANASSYTIGNLAAGTWYFAAAAYSSVGTQSSLTPVVSKSVP